MLLPDRLRIVWEEAERGQRTREQAVSEQERLLDDYRATWTRALLQGSETDLRTSLLREVAVYYGISERQRPAHFYNFQQTPLPSEGFDMILAMDVFEHLADPVATVESLHRALRPGGVLFARIQAAKAETHPQHIVPRLRTDVRPHARARTR